MATNDKTKELWVDWTRDAANQYEPPENVEDGDELAGDMVEFAISYADWMLEEYEKRFSGSTGKRPARRRKKKRDEDDDDEPEDE